MVSTLGVNTPAKVPNLPSGELPNTRLNRVLIAHHQVVRESMGHDTGPTDYGPAARDVRHRLLDSLLHPLGVPSALQQGQHPLAIGGDREPLAAEAAIGRQRTLLQERGAILIELDHREGHLTAVTRAPA
jgi:hypothetical protein